MYLNAQVIAPDTSIAKFAYMYPGVRKVFTTSGLLRFEEVLEIKKSL